MITTFRGKWVFENEEERGRLMAALMLKTGKKNQKELAEKIGVDVRTVRRVFRDEGSLSTKWRQDLCEILKVDINGLREIIVPSDESRLPSFIRIRGLVSDPAAKAERLYNGNPPTLIDIASGFDVLRDKYTSDDGIRSCVVREVNRRAGIRTVAILGAGGTGKTTVLLRTAYDLALEGFTVLKLIPEWNKPSRGLANQLTQVVEEANTPVVVVIDDVSEYFLDPSLPRILQESAELNILLLVSDKINRWSTVDVRLPSAARTRFYLSQLNPRECERFVDQILEYERNGTLQQISSTKTREERLDVWQVDANRHLIAAMLELRHGEPFETILAREFDAISSDDGKRAYALVSYFESLGLPMPESLVFRALDIADEYRVEKLIAATEGLMVFNSDGKITSRNHIIGRFIASRFLSRKEPRKQALSIVFAKVAPHNQEELNFFLRAFTGERRYKQFYSTLYRDLSFTREFFEFVTKNADVGLKKYAMSTHAMVEKVFGDWDKAKGLFHGSIELDGGYGYPYRQLAWMDIADLDLEGASEKIRKAVDCDPENLTALHHATEILTRNTLHWFKEARKYFDKLQELEPSNPKLIEKIEEYNDITKELEYLEGLRDDDYLPESIWAHMKPRVLIDKARFGETNRKVRQNAFNVLRNILSNPLETSDAEERVSELRKAITKADKKGQAAIKAIEARELFLHWRALGEPKDYPFDDLDELFKQAIELDPENAFAHCWYGTFLKDCLRAFSRAAQEYSLSRDLAINSRDHFVKEHPLILNNLAVLIIDEVVASPPKRPITDLGEAEALLRKAIERAAEVAPKFLWPEKELSRCIELKERLGSRAA